MLYGCIQELAKLLEIARPGGACKGIIHLVQQMLANKDVENIWRACRGGLTPALHFIEYLNQIQQCPTIATFMSFIGKEESGQSDVRAAVYKNIEDLLKDSDHSIGLEELNYTELEKIAECLSEKIYLPDLEQFTQKDVASKAGINLNTIYALNSPQDKARELSSMTEEFVSLLSTKYPDCRVAVIIHGLRKIERNDAIQDCEMFKPCREEGCLDRCLKEEEKFDLC